MTKITQTLTGRLLGAAIATAALISPSLALAQDYPPPPAAQDYPPPGYADQGPDQGASQTIQGQIVAINGTWNITVHDANGYADSVALHQGTIINPTGLTLEPGMNVTIDGYADGPNFDAMEIDTPYQYQGPPPVAVYYGPGAWYPGYAYGWGPSFNLVFNIGTRSWNQRPFYFGGVYRHPLAPPIGWQSQPHGFIGHAAGGFPQRTAYRYPQNRGFVAPQQSRGFNAPQYSAPRNYNAPEQRSFAAPQQRTFSAPQQRTFAAPQQRTYSAPQARSYAAPARSYSAPAARPAPAQRGGGGGQRGDRNHR
jgi:hypothetical protein